MSFLIALPTGVVTLFIGGNEMRGAMLAFVTMPVVFVAAFVVLSRRSKNLQAPSSAPLKRRKPPTS